MWLQYTGVHLYHYRRSQLFDLLQGTLSQVRSQQLTSVGFLRVNKIRFRKSLIKVFILRTGRFGVRRHRFVFFWTNPTKHSVSRKVMQRSQEPATRPYPKPDQSSRWPSSHFLNIYLPLFSHLRLGLPSGLFPSDFPVNILYAYLPFRMRDTRPPFSF